MVHRHDMGFNRVRQSRYRQNVKQRLPPKLTGKLCSRQTNTGGPRHRSRFLFTPHKKTEMRQRQKKASSTEEKRRTKGPKGKKKGPNRRKTKKKDEKGP